jgi:hypothetical protein
LGDFEFIEIKRLSPYTFQTFRFDCDEIKWLPPKTYKRRFRPIVGDHIHQGIAISLNGEPLIMRDRNMTEPIPYEDFHATCPNPPKYAYIKKWYHTGIHTHCDNILHIHPWSAPKQLRVTGKDVTLDMWFESVGIQMGSLSNRLRMPGDIYRTWTLEYYVHVDDEHPVMITQNAEKMANLWLVDHHAFIKLYVGEAPEKNKDVLNYYSKSKFKNKYPRRNIYI